MAAISVITVAYNNAGTIGDTMQSVCAQSHPHVDYIVVDGDSNDGTQDIVHSFSGLDVNFISEPDAGIYHAMNKGINMAVGDIIGFLNADDVYDNPGVLSMVDEAIDSRSADCCYGDLEYVARDNLEQVVRYWRSEEFAPGLLSKGWYPPHPTFFARREVYQQYGVFDLDYLFAADVELMWRFLAHGGLKSDYIPSVLVRMRMGGTSNRSIANVIRQNIWLYRAMKKNGIHCSKLFLLYKFISRAMQFIRAFNRGK